MIHTTNGVIGKVTHKYAIDLCYTCGAKLQEPLVKTDDQVLFCPNEKCKRNISKSDYVRATNELTRIQNYNHYLESNFRVSECNGYASTFIDGGFELYTHDGIHFTLSFYDEDILIMDSHGMRKLINQRNLMKDIIK